MKVKKISKLVIKGPFVAIGTRGKSTLVAIPQFDELPEGLVLGENPLPSKERGDQNALWLTSCSYVASRNVGTFTLLKLDDAVKLKLVKIHEGVKFTRTSDGKKFVGDIVVPYSHQDSDKQPRIVGVLNARGWPNGQIESKLVHEVDENKPSRNRRVVARFNLK